MPYRRKSMRWPSHYGYGKRAKKSGRAGMRSYGVRVPRLPRFDRATIIAERQNIDVKPMLYTTYITGGTAPYYSLVSSGDAACASCPLSNFYSSTGFATVKAMYTEYRIKKVSVHAMLNAV